MYYTLILSHPEEYGGNSPHQQFGIFKYISSYLTCDLRINFCDLHFCPSLGIENEDLKVVLAHLRELLRLCQEPSALFPHV